jgi:hypothetical protein
MGPRACAEKLGDGELDADALLRAPPKEVRGAPRHATRHDFALRDVSLAGLDARLRARLDAISRAAARLDGAAPLARG